ncbi:MAG: hypothetical protein II039_13605 [Treponema sp.]|nr:hypothetical protein [Treponema sp.]
MYKLAENSTLFKVLLDFSYLEHTSILTAPSGVNLITGFAGQFLLKQAAPRTARHHLGKIIVQVFEKNLRGKNCTDAIFTTNPG